MTTPHGNPQPELFAWPREYEEVAAELAWDDRRKRYAWRRKLGQTNRQIAAAEGYSIWNSQRLRAIVYGDLSAVHGVNPIRSAVELANEIERRMREKRQQHRARA